MVSFCNMLLYCNIYDVLLSVFSVFFMCLHNSLQVEFHNTQTTYACHVNYYSCTSGNCGSQAYSSSAVIAQNSYGLNWCQNSVVTKRRLSSNLPFEIRWDIIRYPKKNPPQITFREFCICITVTFHTLCCYIVLIIQIFLYTDTPVTVTFTMVMDTGYQTSKTQWDRGTCWHMWTWEPDLILANRTDLPSPPCCPFSGNNHHSLFCFKWLLLCCITLTPTILCFLIWSEIHAVSLCYGAP